MTDCEKDFEDAKKKLSEAQTLYNRLKPEIESQSSLSEEDEMLWLLVKTRFSDAAKRLQDARAAFLKEQAVIKRLSDPSGTGKADLVSRVENRLDKLSASLIPRTSANRKQTRQEESRIKQQANAQKTIGALLDAGGENARFIKKGFDDIFAPNGVGHCTQFDSKEEWDAFYAIHPIPTDEERGKRIALGQQRILDIQREIEQREAAKEAALSDQPTQAVKIVEKILLSDKSTEAQTESPMSDEEFDRLYPNPEQHKATTRITLDEEAIERAREVNNSDPLGLKGE